MHAHLIQIKIVLPVDPVMHVAGINASEASAVEGLILESHVTMEDACHRPTRNKFVTFSFIDSHCLFALGFGIRILLSIYKSAFFLFANFI